MRTHKTHWIFLTNVCACAVFILFYRSHFISHLFSQPSKSARETTPSLLQTAQKKLTTSEQQRNENRLNEKGYMPAPDRNTQTVTQDSDAFEPSVEEDFPTTESENPKVPHIIHFIFITGMGEKQGIPLMYKDNVMSFYKFNPDWTFYFWSDTSARELVATRQPGLLSIYDNYSLVIKKADAFRYVLLYEFGGVYVDLDMKCLRPLARATIKFSCILTPEPFEHSSILYKKPYIFSNAISLCRPKHPLFKQLIEALPKSAYLKSTMESTGPLFLTPQVTKYLKYQSNWTANSKPLIRDNTPYFFNPVSADENNDALYVANTQYFMNSFDTGYANGIIQSVCFTNKTESKLMKRGCKLWKSRKTRIRGPFAFTDHNWVHMYSIKKSTLMIPIQSLIPKIKEN